MSDINDIWDDDEDRQGHVRDDRPSVQDAAPLPVGYIPLPAGLHPDTAKLVCAFAEALAAKLRLAEAKYGYSDGWRRDNWLDELVAKLVEHVHKGDPRDVAAYCAFAWFHGWSIAPAAPTAQGQGWQDIASAPRDGRTIIVAFSRGSHSPTPHHGAYRWSRPFWVGIGEQHEDQYATHWMPLPSAPSAGEA
ncbi:DUF551 domain-containing protein [Azospirillum brasilense]|uniref:DUF551 domain-containing protein n=1 Tax=Azospirillum brasilense TaxID=192 RepID=UPI001EDC42B2|nr:DUF551 domain-containing protein [Azospirillum brasilense]UKJ74566.1 hypothetical protein H1Q64_18580 [Azospirillum brasilense]